MDYSRLPGEQFRREWICAYLDARGVAASAERVDTMLRDVAMFGAVSHLYWGTWALVQAAVSEINFDYLSYALIRLNQVPHEFLTASTQ